METMMKDHQFHIPYNKVGLVVADLPYANDEHTASNIRARPSSSHAHLLFLPRRRRRQQLLRLLILRPTNLALPQLRLTPTLARTNTRPRSALQPLRILFPQILRFAVASGSRLIIIISQCERIIVFFRAGRYGGQWLPFLAVSRAVGGVDFVDGASLGRFGLGFEEVGVGGFAAAGARGLGGGCRGFC